ncbi:hypothetical protein V6N11_083333 [Hibiscus sabdariffa]|uniref:Uncharacterized protein n=1 Tax=Hibiscus sabdariffa TaxID=183260 RepID=A0ABR2QM31_9ROSI
MDWNGHVDRKEAVKVGSQIGLWNREGQRESEIVTVSMDKGSCLLWDEDSQSKVLGNYEEVEAERGPFQFGPWMRVVFKEKINGKSTPRPGIIHFNEGRGDAEKNMKFKEALEENEVIVGVNSTRGKL